MDLETATHTQAAPDSQLHSEIEHQADRFDDLLRTFFEESIAWRDDWKAQQQNFIQRYHLSAEEERQVYEAYCELTLADAIQILGCKRDEAEAEKQMENFFALYKRGRKWLQHRAVAALRILQGCECPGHQKVKHKIATFLASAEKSL